MNWNQRLTQAREAKKLRKSAFARLVGVSAPTVTDWESGEIDEIKGKNLMAVCEVLGITEEWLMHGTDGGRSTTLDDSMRLECETGDELRLLAAYRLGDETARRTFNVIADDILRAADNGQPRPARGGS